MLSGQDNEVKGGITIPLPGSGDDGNAIPDLAQFDLLQEIAASEQRKPWPSGIHARTLYKKQDLRIVLISMERTARMKEHHVDGTSSVQVLQGHLRYSAQGQEHELKPGGLITLGASIKHEVEAVEDSVFLLTIGWPGNQRLLAMDHRGYGT